MPVVQLYSLCLLFASKKEGRKAGKRKRGRNMEGGREGIRKNGEKKGRSRINYLLKQ